VDCGGSCAACPTCADGKRNGDELGTDCGGSCAAECPPTCEDQLQNGDEVKVDCGGSCLECGTACTVDRPCEATDVIMKMMQLTEECEATGTPGVPCRGARSAGLFVSQLMAHFCSLVNGDTSAVNQIRTDRYHLVKIELFAEDGTQMYVMRDNQMGCKTGREPGCLGMDDTIGPGDTITIDCGESAGEQEVRDRAGPNKPCWQTCSLALAIIRKGWRAGEGSNRAAPVVQIDFEAARVFLGQWFGLELATLDCHRVPNGPSEFDCAGECEGTAVFDCEGTCGGTHYIDSCGVCGGFELCNWDDDTPPWPPYNGFEEWNGLVTDAEHAHDHGR
jgi:hypothetical protein